jgi:DNA-binding HxlR family transcriptional regulator
MLPRSRVRSLVQRLNFTDGRAAAKLRPVKSYGQFCPIAKAAELLCERWTPLVLRELMYGSRRFNDIARGVPLMSRGLLSARLRELRGEGVIAVDRERGYQLTPAGEALRPLIEQMGLWAQHWGKATLSEDDLDDALLVWGLRRMLRLPPSLLERRTVLRLDFFGLPPAARVARRSWWLVVERGEVEVCLKDPGYEVDVILGADLRSFMEVLLGQRRFQSALRARSIRLSGAPAYVRQLPRWLPLNGEAKQALGIMPGRDSHA